MYGSSRDEGFLPSEVQESLKVLQSCLKRPDVEKLTRLYVDDIPALTAKYYKASAWPAPETVEKKIEGDKMFAAFYQEIYYRHIYSKLEPNIHDRFHSFQNYIELFNIFLQLDNDKPQIDLPDQWLWDIIDEFIHQFQSFHEYRTDVGNSSDLDPTDAKMLKDHVHVWSAQTIIRYLGALVEKAQNAVNRYSKMGRSGSSFFHSVHDFSIVAQAQVMCLISDYTSALEVLESLNFNSINSAFFIIEGCRASLHYYMGFAYMMLRRYRDAIDVFSTFLRGDTKLTFQNETLEKADPIKDLLGIALSLCPTNIDDSLLQSVQSKLGECYSQMAASKWEAYEEIFYRSCPPFISPYVPSFEHSGQKPSAPGQVQADLLRQEVEQRQNFADTYNVLKMCTSMRIDTLSQAIKLTTETLTTQLLNVKHKTRSKRHRNLASKIKSKEKYKPPIEGDWIGEPELNFYLSKDMVFVGEKNNEKSCGDYFIEQTLSLEKLVTYIDDAVKFRETL